MQSGSLDTVAQGKKCSQIMWYLMNGTEYSSAIPLTCDINRRELGVFTPRKDDH